MLTLIIEKKGGICKLIFKKSLLAIVNKKIQKISKYGKSKGLKKKKL